jgi:hypothetical protein
MTDFNLSERINDKSRLNKDISESRNFYYEEDVEEFVKLLEEFIERRAKTLSLNLNNPRIDWKLSGITELSNILYRIDELWGKAEE